jgi:hypothetical protein
MLIAGEKHEDAVELLKKMEGSERFRFPVLKGTTVGTTGGNTFAKGSPIIQFAIETYYTPANRIQSPALGAKEGMQ